MCGGGGFTPTGHGRRRPRAFGAVEEQPPGGFDAARDPARMEEATARAAFEQLGGTRLSWRRSPCHNPLGLFVPVSRLNEAAARATLRLLEGARLRGWRNGWRPRRRISRGDRCRDRRHPALRFTVKVDRLDTLAALRGSGLRGGRRPGSSIPWAVEPGPGLLEPARGARWFGARGVASGSRLSLPVHRAPLGREGTARASEGAAGRPDSPAWRSPTPPPGRAAWARPGRPWASTSDLGLRPLRGEPRAARQLFDMGIAGSRSPPRIAPEDPMPSRPSSARRPRWWSYEDSPLFVSESCPYANLRGDARGRRTAPSRGARFLLHGGGSGW